MLKQIFHQKKLLTLSLSNLFSRLGAHEKMIKENPHVKDYTQNPVVKVNIEEARLQFKRDSIIDGVKLLSEASERTKREVKLGKEVVFDKVRINKEIKDHSKKQIDNARESSYTYLLENDQMSTNLSKVEENKRIIQELKEFKKLYFEKKEIQRLLKNQERRPEYYLPLNDLRSKEKEQASRFQAYKQQQLDAKNQRIQNMLEGSSKENKKLSLLVSSGLLDTTKNIRQIILTSTELLAKETKQIAKNSPNEFHEDIILDSKLEQSQENEEKINLKTNSDEQQQDKLALEELDSLIISQNQPESIKSNSITVEGEIKPLKSFEQYADKIASMGLDITKEELSFVDFEALAKFFDEFVGSTFEEKLKTLNKIQIIEGIRAYENYLFDTGRNGDITLRKKGRIEFKDFTLKERLNYVKYNIQKPSEIFQMMQNSSSDILTPALTSQFLAKLSTFRFESKQNYLALIGNYNYRALLRHCLNNVKQMNDIELVDSIWSIGKIHKDEHGVVYEKLFNNLMSSFSSQIKKRIKKIPLKDISFMIRGYLQLSHLSLNQDLNNEILQEIKSRLESKQGERLTIYSIRGLMLFLSHIGNPESKQIMETFLLPLLNKDEIVEKLDNSSLSEIFQSLASIVPQSRDQISLYLDKIDDKVKQISKQISTDTISDVVTVISACNLEPKQLYQELKKRTIFNFREEKPCQETSVAKILCSFAQYDVVKSLHKYIDTQNSNGSLTDNLLLFSYFPTLVFHQQSPQYLFYNRIAKEIDKVKEKFSQKWISMSIFGVASSQYKNLEFIDDCCKQVLMSQSQENTPKNLNELAMFLFGYSNIKRSNTYSRKLLQQVRELYMKGHFKKATSIAWAQFFNTLTNTNSREELDEVEKQFAEVVYFDKIKANLSFLTQNILISLVFSFSRLQVDTQIIQEIISHVNIDSLNNFQLSLLNIAIRLSNIAETVPQVDEALKQQYYRIKEVDHYIRDIVKEKLQFYEGQRFSFEQIQIRIKIIIDEINAKNLQEQEVNQLTIQDFFDEKLGITIDFYIPKTKQAIFLYTYDHCLIQESTDNKIVCQNNLSGLFQAREEILKHSGYKVVQIFTHDFNQIGVKSSIEEEKRQKYSFIQKLIVNEK